MNNKEEEIIVNSSVDTPNERIDREFKRANISKRSNISERDCNYTISHLKTENSTPFKIYGTIRTVGGFNSDKFVFIPKTYTELYMCYDGSYIKIPIIKIEGDNGDKNEDQLHFIYRNWYKNLPINWSEYVYRINNFDDYQIEEKFIYKTNNNWPDFVEKDITTEFRIFQGEMEIYCEHCESCDNCFPWQSISVNKDGSYSFGPEIQRCVSKFKTHKCDCEKEYGVWYNLYLL